MTKPIKDLLADIDVGGPVADEAIHVIEVHAVIRDKVLRGKVSDRLFRFAEEHAQEDQRVWGALRRAISMAPRSLDVVERCKPFLSPKMPPRVRQVVLQSLVNKGPFNKTDATITKLVLDIVIATNAKDLASMVLGMNAVCASITFGIRDVLKHLKIFKEHAPTKPLLISELKRIAAWHRDPQSHGLYIEVRNTLDPPKSGV